MARIFILFALTMAMLVSLPTMAGMAKTFRVEGVVDSIEHDEIILWVRGKLVKVARDSIPKHYKVVAGEQVEAYVPSNTLVATAKKRR